MGNVLSEEKKQQVLALGRLGWSLRKIEEATGVRRETAGAYLCVDSSSLRVRIRDSGRPDGQVPRASASQINLGTVFECLRSRWARLSFTSPRDELPPRWQV